MANRLDVTAKFLSNATGRDKLNRLVQYYCKFLVWVGTSKGWEKDRLERLNGLMAAMSCTRKAMRVGKQTEHLVTIKKSMSIKDDFTRLLTILKALGLSLWLVYDTLGFLHTAKTIKLNDSKLIATRGNQFWLAAIISSLALNIYKLRWSMIKLDQEVRIGKPIPVVETQQQYIARIADIRRERKSIAIATLTDMLDVFIPGINLEYIKLDGGYAGLAGVITSFVGIYTTLQSIDITK